MLTRIPIGTVPGLVSAIVSTDVLAMATEGASGRVTRFFLRRDRGLLTGSVTAQLRTATGGGGSGISITLGVGVEGASSTSPLTFTSSESLYLRVTAADGSSEDLSGWIEVETTAPATAALTTLARVKTFDNITDSLNDSLLNDAIAGVSVSWQRYMRRLIVSTAIVGEKHSGGQNAITLRQFPAIAGTLVIAEDGAAISSGDFELEAATGIVYRLAGGFVDRWARGIRNVSIDYSSGFASVPEDLQLYATQQVIQIFRQSKQGGNRIGERGTILDTGGSSQYLIGPYIPGAQEVLDRYRDFARR